MSMDCGGHDALVAAGEKAERLAVSARHWFVYDNERYYPSATIIEADTAEAALAAYKEQTKHLGFHGVAVFPLDALALWTCGYTDGGSIGQVLGQG